MIAYFNEFGALFRNSQLYPETAFALPWLCDEYKCQTGLPSQPHEEWVYMAGSWGLIMTTNT